MKSELAKQFNSHYTNIVKSATGEDPTKLEIEKKKLLQL